YACLTPMDTPVADASAWLLALVRGEKPDAQGSRLQAVSMGLSVKPEVLAVGVGNGLTLTLTPATADLTNSPGVGEGNRNAMLCRYAGVHIARGESLEQIAPKALAWAAKCNPPYPEGKTLDTVRRLWRAHHAKAGASTDTDASPPPG